MKADGDGVEMCQMLTVKTRSRNQPTLNPLMIIATTMMTCTHVYICNYKNQLENLIDPRVENDTFKSIFGLLWPWPLTSWPPELIFTPLPRGPLMLICTKMGLFSKYRVHKFGNRQTNGKVENIVPAWHGVGTKTKHKRTGSCPEYWGRWRRSDSQDPFQRASNTRWRLRHREDPASRDCTGTGSRCTGRRTWLHCDTGYWYTRSSSATVHAASATLVCHHHHHHNLYAQNNTIHWVHKNKTREFLASFCLGLVKFYKTWRT